MSLKMLSFLLILFLLEMKVTYTLQYAKYARMPEQLAVLSLSLSCLDYLKAGYSSDGIYKIRDIHTKQIITVYCDMNSEPGSAWTLVMSLAMKNRKLTAFRSRSLLQNAPVNAHSPNWDLYRMSLSQMNHLKSQSTHWRATCSFPIHKVDYTDYVRVNFSDFDIMTFAGRGICKNVEFVNIRGNQCVQCTSKWWKNVSKYVPHIDSSEGGCELDARVNSTSSEDNFGFVDGVHNKNFRCSAGELSTTNWWFGGNM